MAGKHEKALSDLARIIESLTSVMGPDVRFQQLLDGLSGLFPCDAASLLKLQREYLQPIAVKGLTLDTLGRRFYIEQHPRFLEILDSSLPVQFPSNSSLPDPFDGLVIGHDHLIKVHDCIGVRLQVDGETWGVLCLEALAVDAFDQMRPEAFRTAIAIVAATIKMVSLIHRLEDKIAYEHALNQTLLDSTYDQHSDKMIGESQVMKILAQDIEVVATSKLTVLILGDTGTGKELIAKQIHRLSDRGHAAMVQMNCASLPEHVVESELFGHVRGAYTGAIKDRKGKFKLADKGTLFLDEIGELPLSIQAKLLRVLQTGEIQAVGSDQQVTVDVRIVAATNRDLTKEVKEGRFRADLYHRLSVYPIEAPRLCRRDSDVLLLAGFFMEQCRGRFGTVTIRLDDDSKKRLMSYSWPGNVRELEHTISRATLKACHGNNGCVVTISPEHLGLESDVDYSNDNNHEVPGNESLRTALDRYQTQLITDLLDQHNDNWAEVARSLDVDRANLHRLAKRLNLK